MQTTAPSLCHMSIKKLQQNIFREIVGTPPARTVGTSHEDKGALVAMLGQITIQNRFV